MTTSMHQIIRRGVLSLAVIVCLVGFTHVNTVPTVSQSLLVNSVRITTQASGERQILIADDGQESHGGKGGGKSHG